MKKYIFELSAQANEDIQSFIDFIIFDYHSPLTGTRYYNGLFKTLKSLSHIAESLPISNKPELQHFGFNVRRINYKKMAIIYTVHQDIVYIHRIIPQSTISGS